MSTTRSRWTRLAPLALALAFGPPSMPAPARADEPSMTFEESIRHTIEVRNRKRRRVETSRPGRIVPYPMPPVLVIRQTPEAHDEIRDFLRLLRGF
jgi:hypothetical protein